MSRVVSHSSYTTRWDTTQSAQRFGARRENCTPMQASPGATFGTTRERPGRKPSACSSALRALRENADVPPNAGGSRRFAGGSRHAPLRRRTLTARVRKGAWAGSPPHVGRFHWVEFALPRDRIVVRRCVGCAPICRVVPPTAAACHRPASRSQDRCASHTSVDLFRSGRWSSSRFGTDEFRDWFTQRSTGQNRCDK